MEQHLAHFSIKVVFYRKYQRGENTPLNDTEQHFRHLDIRTTLALINLAQTLTVQKGFPAKI